MSEGSVRAGSQLAGGTYFIDPSLRSKLTPCRTGAYQIPLFRMCVSLKNSLPQEHRPCPI